MKVLNLAQIQSVNFCRIWSPTEFNTPKSLPATHYLKILYFDTGKGWGSEPERRLEGQLFTKLG